MVAADQCSEWKPLQNEVSFDDRLRLQKLKFSSSFYNNSCKAWVYGMPHFAAVARPAALRIPQECLMTSLAQCLLGLASRPWEDGHDALTRRPVAAGEGPYPRGLQQVP